MKKRASTYFLMHVKIRSLQAHHLLWFTFLVFLLLRPFAFPFEAMHQLNGERCQPNQPVKDSAVIGNLTRPTTLMAALGHCEKGNLTCPIGPENVRDYMSSQVKGAVIRKCWFGEAFSIQRLIVEFLFWRPRMTTEEGRRLSSVSTIEIIFPHAR